MRTSIVRAALAAVLVITAVGFAGPQASAATYPSKITSSAPLDWCPGNASICSDARRITTLAAGTAVRMICWLDVPSRSGSALPRWFYIEVSNGTTGWVKAERVDLQSTVGWCRDNRAVAASLWTTGLDEYNQAYPTPTDKSNMSKTFGFTQWGTYGDWSGDCASFAALAYLSTGTTIHFDNAVDIWNYYKRLGRTSSTRTPPRGALVFWDIARPYGHVAVSLGNGRVVTTLGMDNERKPTTDVALSHFSSDYSKYLGWVLP